MCQEVEHRSLSLSERDELGDGHVRGAAAGLLDRGFDHRPDPLPELGLRFQHARLLVLEQLVEGRPRDPGAPGDLGDLRVRVALVGDGLHDRVEQSRALIRTRSGETASRLPGVRLSPCVGLRMSAAHPRSHHAASSLTCLSPSSLTNAIASWRPVKGASATYASRGSCVASA